MTTDNELTLAFYRLMEFWGHPLKKDLNSETLEVTRIRLADFLFAFGVTIPVLTVFAILVLSAVFYLLRKSENLNTPHDSDANIQTVEKIMMNENPPDYVQNHMISVQRVLPSLFRKGFTLPLSLSIMRHAMIKQRTRPGFLGSLGTVHFARWVRLPKTDNYIFVSNYDGSFESYLEDFITKVGEPLNGAWSHCIGYPKTSSIFFGGSQDGDRFIRWARGSMQATPFWYSAYPDLSVEQIRRNALIRDGIARIQNPSDAEAWLDLFDSMVRQDHALQTEQIQSLVFGGAKELKHGCCLIIESDDDKTSDRDFKKWLQHVQSRITFGDVTPKNKLTYLAISAEGLIKAGLKNDLNPDREWTGNQEIKTEPGAIKFSTAFSLGMHNPTRKRILGDLPDKAEADSGQWEWGNEENPMLAVLLIYTESEESLYAQINEDREVLETLNLSCKVVNLVDPTQPEHFGFKDGISNPILKGTRQAAKNPNSIHVINPGEIILGYKDDRGFFPPSPQIEAYRDSESMLPAPPQKQPQKYPKFQGASSDKFRDLGRNGSYLVIRQLEQNKDAFDSGSEMIAREIFPYEYEHGDIERENFARKAIQAKMMGRWQDGRPLISSPVKTIKLADGQYKLMQASSVNDDYVSNSQTMDNEFLFGRDDPQGHACPFGSHIRRVNPRDSLHPDDPRELGVSNRHRILRRGRSYTMGGDNPSDGLFFVCLNASIERQFEFIQQTWIGAKSFHGLKDEVDPIAGQRPGNNQSFTLQMPGRDTKCRGLQSFVQLKGGGYFFMPGKDALKFIAH